MIRVTQAIGMDMVAEGVETKDQADFRSECGCDIAQGFYYAKPMLLEDFNKKCKTRQNLDLSVAQRDFF